MDVCESVFCLHGLRERGREGARGEREGRRERERERGEREAQTLTSMQVPGRDTTNGCTVVSDPVHRSHKGVQEDIAMVIDEADTSHHAVGAI